MSARSVITQACGHVYHVVHSDRLGRETWEVCEHPVIRKTGKKIFAVRNHRSILFYKYEGEIYQEQAFALDRSKLEAGEEVSAGAYEFSLNRAALEAYIAARKAELEEAHAIAEARYKERMAAAPPCLVALGIGWPCDEGELTFRYKVQIKVKTHRGEDTTELSQNFEEALRYVREHAAELEPRAASGSCRVEVM